MAIRKCPQCKTATEDKYGFCIKCGYEFQNSGKSNKICIKCRFKNPNKAEHCVRCGTPLNIENKVKNFDVLTKLSKNSNNNTTPNEKYTPTSKIWIILGYFSIMGIIGIIIALYLITRKDPVAKKHGFIQLFIITVLIAIITLLRLKGVIDQNTIIENYTIMGSNLTRF